jgi:ABC-2 type transport system permease protein
MVSLLGGSAAATSAVHVNLSAPTVVVFLAYFLMGYFLYSSMLAAIAAMVNTEMEARQAANPVIMLLVVSYVLMFAILNDPNGPLAFWLSIVPFTAPIAMPVRWAAAQVPAWQIAVSLAVMASSVVGVAWVASRIYRVGILMYGKRPTLKELVRWVRTT